MDIYLPAAISFGKSSGFLVLRSENIQLPEDESSGSCILPGLHSKYFRPHLVNWDDFAPSMTSARITPPPAVAAYRLTPELSGFSHIWDKLDSISLNGKCCRLSNNSRLRKLSSPWPNISMNKRLGRIGSNKKAHHYSWWASLFSNFLSSQIASNQVLSAFTSLTSVFGMGTGVSL